MDDRTAWLDSWCKTRRLNQQDLARRWATRNDPEPMLEALPQPPITMKHSQFILKNGKKAYKRWLEAGEPDKEAPIVCPVMTMVAEFFVLERYPYLKRWHARCP